MDLTSVNQDGLAGLSKLVGQPGEADVRSDDSFSFFHLASMMNLFAQRCHAAFRFLNSMVVIIFAAIVVLAFGTANIALSQPPGGGFGLPEPGGQYPSQAYYNALTVYRDGDLENAIRGFEMAMRSTRTDVNGKWIDSIPPRVMLAECYWHLGHLPACRLQLDEASRIAIQNRGWLGQLDFDSINNVGAATARTTNLWPEVAAVRLIPLPKRMPFRSGQILTEQGLAAGGVIQTPTIKSVDAIEVMRTLAIMSHRRRVLLGPLANDDALAREVVESTKVPSGLNQPLGQSLVYAMRACEYYGIAEDKTVVNRAATYAVINGGVHPLTPALLLCGLKVGSQGDGSRTLSPEARQALVSIAQQITNSAAALDQFELIGEGLQVAVGVADAAQLVRVEQTASMAARTLLRQSRLASLHCYLVAADAAVSAGRVDAANENLQAAIAIASRRDVRFPRLQAYGAYVAARLAAQSGQAIGIGSSGTMADSMRSMADFVLNQRDRNRPVISMPFLYQADLVLGSLGGNVGNQSAKRVLEGYGGDIGITLWRQDPLNAMAAVYFDDSAMHSALLNIAAVENSGDDVLKQTDRLLAKRFTSRLPLQGRLLQFRTLATSPVESLWPSARLELNDASTTLKLLREQTQKTLVAVGNPGADPEPKPIDAAGISLRSATEAGAMEAVLSGLALSRSTVPELNPPRIVKTDAALVPDGVALVTFVFDHGKIFATATRDGATRTWVVAASTRVPSMINKLLQDIGANRGRGKRLPEDDQAWRSTAATLRSYLFPESSGWNEENLTKIIIVPDGPLWYLPFGLLPLTSADLVKQADADQAAEAGKTWSDVVDLQFAPTPGFALRSVGVTSDANRIAMISNNFFAVRDAAMNESMFNEVMASAVDAAKFAPAQAPPTSLLGGEIGHLMIAAPVTPNLTDPMATAIVPIDASPSNAGPFASHRLSEWVRFPAGAPQSVVLAGFRSTASGNQLGDGSELFFPMAALRASGVRDVLISRWATGGQSAATVLTEIVNELPHTTLAAATRRGLMMLRSSDLSVSREPLLGKADEEHVGLTGNEPLFWSTYIAGGGIQLPPPDSED